ncbi:S9 family peptidase [Shewanella sp. C32]|uniref:S9 family peptidase n=1 Tax=Shewanella electrica TaxID=515560 RepID=A0ABT2FHM2_9GAMM|nr:S9 family peptidase [Shewanella electrica]MCH1923359.1 S9 family peptidase [Shewanella electrica]MCS4555456.1 S9 family peptidase [Shewanella electrica]
MNSIGSVARWAGLAAVVFLSACSKAPDTNTSLNDTPSQESQTPYGSWQSPITAQEVYGAHSGISELQSSGDMLYFTESDPAAQGQSGIKRIGAQDQVTQVLAAQFGVGSRVHEYGGAPFLAIGQSIFATKMADQRFYRIAPNQEPVALTPEGTRHAGCVFFSKGSRIICVREDHRQPGEAVNSLVAINLNQPGEGDIYATGHDFYGAPAINRDNTQLAWVTWDHPNMPWDNTQLWVGKLDKKGALTDIQQPKMPGKGAIMQPLYSPTGQLYFIADFDNWWNLYRINAEGRVEQVTKLEGEIGGPAWGLGSHAYAFENEHSIVFNLHHEGQLDLMRIDVDSGVTEELATDFASVKQLISYQDNVYFIGAKATPARGIYRVTGRGTELVYSPEINGVEPEYIAKPRSVSFVTANKHTAYGLYYAPTNPDYQAPAGSVPPLVMMLHGGPTYEANRAYRGDIQFWTSRGFAVFDLNYRGSTGYGRKFRRSLYGQWGVADVDDAVYAAKYLVNEKLADPDKLAIRGGSAGGFSVLAALAFHDVFKAGTSYYGVSDIEVLAKETHKFESRYLDQLIGPYPQKRQLYHDRSPLYHLDGLDEPLLLFQGLEDKVVPPNQSEMIYQALRDKGVPTAYIAFPGEGHGFRQPENNIRALETELAFYGRVFGFKPAGQLPLVPLENAGALVEPSTTK